jgi:excisionase family DNA binding protein
MTEPLLTPRELAELLGVSIETVLRKVRAGVLPAIRLPGGRNGRIRFRPEAIEAWLVEHETTSAATEESPDTAVHRARRGGGYRGALMSEAPDTAPPLAAVTTEEDSHAR